MFCHDECDSIEDACFDRCISDKRSSTSSSSPPPPSFQTFKRTSSSPTSINPSSLLPPTSVTIVPQITNSSSSSVYQRSCSSECRWMANLCRSDCNHKLFACSEECNSKHDPLLQNCESNFEDCLDGTSEKDSSETDSDSEYEDMSSYFNPSNSVQVNTIISSSPASLSSSSSSSASSSSQPFSTAASRSFFSRSLHHPLLSSSSSSLSLSILPPSSLRCHLRRINCIAQANQSRLSNCTSLCDVCSFLISWSRVIYILSPFSSSLLASTQWLYSELWWTTNKRLLIYPSRLCNKCDTCSSSSSLWHVLSFFSLPLLYYQLIERYMPRFMILSILTTAIPNKKNRLIRVCLHILLQKSLHLLLLLLSYNSARRSCSFVCTDEHMLCRSHCKLSSELGTCEVCFLQPPSFLLSFLPTSAPSSSSSPLDICS